MAVAPAITPEILKRRAKLDAEKKDLEREARAIGKEVSAIDTDLKASLEKAGKTSLARGGYRVSLIDGRPSVSWKKEFVAANGATKAHEIEQAAPVPKRIDVADDAGAKRRAA